MPAQPQLPREYSNPVSLLSRLKTEPEKRIFKKGEMRVLKLFHDMAKRVPAYKDFLKKHKCNPRQIRTISDFQHIPPIDKDNYLRKYPLDQLCWDGDLKKQSWVISTTSGSTGEPFYFPRQKNQDQQYAVLAEMYLRDNFDIHKKSTLYLNAFPMGAWIGGVFTYQAIRMVAERGNYNLSIISPGIDKQGIINAVLKFGTEFDQIIIGSYGPFLKDILDDGEQQKIDWKRYPLKFIFSAEGFSESFRNYVIRKANLTNPYKDSLNHYGTVDLGTMSHETPISILIRRLALKRKKLYTDLFGQTIKLPTLTQYLPELFFFESIDGNLFCSAYSGLPLVRYDLKDRGDIIRWDDMRSCFLVHDIDIDSEIKKAKLDTTVWRLPFVYVYERSDFAVSFYAFFIYPETIRRALLHPDIEKYVTGKFTMTVKYDSQHNQYLEINTELKRDAHHGKRVEGQVQKVILNQLLCDSSEYRETYKEKGDRVLPHIVFWEYEDNNFFRPGTKQKWVKK